MGQYCHTAIAKFKISEFTLLSRQWRTELVWQSWYSRSITAIQKPPSIDECIWFFSFFKIIHDHGKLQSSWNEYTWSFRQYWMVSTKVWNNLKSSWIPFWQIHIIFLRYCRITASKVYEASKCNTIDGSLANTLFGANKLRDTKAMNRGRKLEPLVLREVHIKTKMDFKRCGLLLSADHPVFGASPDEISALHMF